MNYNTMKDIGIFAVWPKANIQVGRTECSIRG